MSMTVHVHELSQIWKIQYSRGEVKLKIFQYNKLCRSAICAHAHFEFFDRSCTLTLTFLTGNWHKWSFCIFCYIDKNHSLTYPPLRILILVIVS